MAGALLVGVLLMLGLMIHAFRRTFYHFASVHPGRMYRSGTLGGLGLRLATRLHGIDTVVNLRSREENEQPWHVREQALCSRLGIELVDLPMGFDKPPSPAQLRTFLALANDPDRCLLVHCEMGIIRTGMMVLAYQHARGCPVGKDPWAWLPQFGHDIRRRSRPSFEAFVEGYREPPPSHAPNDAAPEGR